MKVLHLIKDGILTGIGAIVAGFAVLVYCALVSELVRLTVSPWLQFSIIIFAIGFLIGIAWNLNKIL
jgi:hypothetical protein